MSDELLAKERDDRVRYLEAALREVAKRMGPYSRDPKTHADNVIDSMAAIAEDALAGTWEEPGLELPSKCSECGWSGDADDLEPTPIGGAISLCCPRCGSIDGVSSTWEEPEEEDDDHELAAAAAAAKAGPSSYAYRGYEIRYEGPPPIPGGERYSWSWTHCDYDGPEDHRHGRAASLGDATRAIDEQVEDDRG